MNEIYLYLGLMYCLTVGQFSAQAQDWQWLREAGSTGNDNVAAFTTDASGNSYLCGSFRDSIRFDATSLYAPTTATAHFMVSYNKAGEVMKAQIAARGDKLRIRGLCLDTQGNMILTGQYSDSASLGTNNVLHLQASTSYDMFVAKFNSDGEILWAKVIGEGGYDEAGGIDCDAQGNIYIVGSYHYSAYAGSAAKIMLASYDAAGNLRWQQTSRQHTNGTYGNAIRVDEQGNSYIAGQFFNYMTFDSNDSLVALSIESQACVAKFDAQGKQLWLRQAGGSGFAGGHRIDIDALGNCYLAGFFRGEVHVGSYTLNGSAGMGYELFVAAYDSKGDARWATQTHGACSLRALNCQSDGSCFVAGMFSGKVQLGTTELQNSNKKGSDMLLAKVLPDGKAAWVEQVHGSYSLSVDGMKSKGQSLVIAGTYRDSLRCGALLSVCDTASTNIYLARLDVGVSAVEEYQTQSPILRFIPNPAEELLMWDKSLTAFQRYSIVDCVGNVVRTGLLTEQTNSLVLHGLSKGMYLLRLENLNHPTQSISQSFLKW